VSNYTNLYKKTRIRLHCQAGISRSGAVAKFLGEYFNLSYSDIVKYSPMIKPNIRIVNILRKISGLYN
jgi:predicted protein tyrosine phosphatase